MATDLIEKWRNQESPSRPEDYRPKKCPPGLAQDWTNTENPGSGDGDWEWDILVDLAYVADSNPYTVKDNVETLLKGLAEGENRE